MSKIIITPLGTVSPYPKNNMNCPGFLVEYNNKKVLLDCGNGITRLLDFPECLKDLNVIVTHYHKDHFGDISSIQYASFVYHNLGLITKKINIYLPKNDIAFNKKSIISNNESYSDYFDIDASYSILIDDLNISFEDNNSHTIESYMVKLQNKDFKIIYTSDIGPTNFSKLVDFCKDADLIICESSFLLEHNSNCKTHMTANDASLLAKYSNAKKLLLTHFWPEIDKNLYLEEALKNTSNVEVAEENKKLILRR
jgi:ribonuclease BN (tRNA processing enzyme)